MPDVADILQLEHNRDLPWAVFDAVWYRQTYESQIPSDVAGPDALRSFYLDRGRSLGHSPNAFFDERWYLSSYPSIADVVEVGSIRSGFDHYCRHGFQDLSPHWLFDVTMYAAAPSEPENGSQAENNGIYAHFLRFGADGGRIAHKFFWPDYYMSHLDPALRQAALEQGPYQHFLRSPSAAGFEARTTPYFDPVWYLETYPSVARDVAEGRYRSALHHFLTNDAPVAFDPLPIFSERAYLSRHSDVGRAVKDKEFRSGYYHFIDHGAGEGRIFNRSIDLAHYVDANPVVRADLLRHKHLNPFTHLLTIGATLGLQSAPAGIQDTGTPEDLAKALFRNEAAVVSLLHARRPLDFTVNGQPGVSVIIAAHNKFDLTLAALASLRDNFTGAIELILVDSGSTDETRRMPDYLKGAKIRRFESNIGFVRACNAGLAEVTAETIIFMNNDVRLAPGAVGNALARLRSSPQVGAVGAKVIRSHGRLQETGCIIWRDGYTSGYLRDRSPLDPEANHVRDVDFCSAVFLVAPSALVKSLGGFDDDYAPCYYEDTDLCVRIGHRGLRIVYDPDVVVHHLEYGSAESAEGAEAAMARGRDIFLKKHGGWIATRYENRPEAVALARFAGPPPHRLLFIDDTVPVRGIGSGFVRANDIIHELAELGISVTVFPTNRNQAPLVKIYSDLPDTAEVMYDQTVEGLEEFLSGRQHYFDTVWVSRTHNLRFAKNALTGLRGPSGKRPRLILDTEAIASVRDKVKSDILLPNADFDFSGALQKEFEGVDDAGVDAIVCVNEIERDILAQHGFTSLAVLGHCRDLRLTPRPFEDRAGLLFVGAMHEADTPNYDSLCWFIDFVMPMVQEQLGSEVKLTVVGYTANGANFDRFKADPRVNLLGAVSDTEPLYNSHRVFIAPTRYAAGVPYKVHEAASYGIPVVTTALLAHQLGWKDEWECLAAEASDHRLFAERISAIYRDESLWRQIRKGAAGRVAVENNRHTYQKRIQTLIL